MKTKLLTLAGVACAIALPVAQAAIVQVTADITTNTTWVSTNEYVLTKVIYVNSGATLTIQPGTIIRGEMMTTATSFDPGTLVVTRFGKINAQGTAANPIIMTSAATDSNGDGAPDGTHAAVGYHSGVDFNSNGTADYMEGTPFWDASPKTSPRPAFAVDVNGTAINVSTAPFTRLWGGFIVMGNAPTNTDADATTAGVQLRAVEGLNPSTTQPLDNIYGGHEPMDNSGVLRYISSRYAGGSLNANNDLNGITLAGVGRGTTVQYLESFNSGDDGIEIFGGSFDASYFTIVSPADDGLDIDEGYAGNIQFVLIIGGNNTDNLAEWDSFENLPGVANGSNTLGYPRGSWSVYNATLIGHPTGASANLGVDRKDDCQANLFNSIIVDTKGTGLRFQNGQTVSGLGTTGPVRDGNAKNSGLTLFRIAGNTSSFATANGTQALTSGDLLGATKYVNTTGGNITFSGKIDLIVRGDTDTVRTTDTDVVASSIYFGSVQNRIANPGFATFVRGSYFGGTGTSLINPVALQTGAGGVANAVSNISNSIAAYPTGGGLTAVTYRGAFATSKTAPLWTTGWTAANAIGILPNTGTTP